MIEFLIGGSAGGLVAALVYMFVRDWSLMRRLACVEAACESLEQRIRGASGNVKREEKAARKQEAIAFVIAGLKAGKKPEDVLKEAAMSYPDVAAELAGVRI